VEDKSQHQFIVLKIKKIGEFLSSI